MHSTLIIMYHQYWYKFKNTWRWYVDIDVYCLEATVLPPVRPLWSPRMLQTTRLRSLLSLSTPKVDSQQFLLAVDPGTGSQQLLPSAMALLWNGSHRQLWFLCHNSMATVTFTNWKNSCLLYSSEQFTTGSTQSHLGNYTVKSPFFKGMSSKILKVLLQSIVL
jgi:hypothetical protein